MNVNEVKIMSQYVNALEQASLELERMYFEKNMAGIDKVKKFINEVQGKISELLKR
jgi:exonuclease VII small subunit